MRTLNHAVVVRSSNFSGLDHAVAASDHLTTTTANTAVILRIQILTIAELLDGKRPMPLIDVGAAYRPTPREKQEGDQRELSI